MRLNDKLKRIMLMVLAGFVLFILIIALISRCNRTRTYSVDEINELKTHLISLAESHFANNPSALPSEGNSTTLSIQTLVEAGRTKPLNEIIRNGEHCTGHILVENNRGYILYLPYINCGELYRSQKLVNVLIDSNNVVTSGNGLYTMHGGFVFRGESVNNFLSFADRIWVILGVNTDGTIRIMEYTNRAFSSPWDDRLNPDSHVSGINNFIHENNVNSRIRDQLIEIYDDEFDDNHRAHFVPQDLCVGKRSVDDDSHDGRTECSDILANQTFGLIAAYEFLRASLDENCSSSQDTACINFNYLSRIRSNFWTITADSESTFRVFRIGGNMTLQGSSSLAGVKVTAHLSSEVLVAEGDGSFSNPFQLVTAPNTGRR